MKHLYFTIWMSVFVLYGDARGQLPQFNTVNLKSYYSGLNSAGWRAMANDADTAGLRAMFARHFTLSSDDSADFVQFALSDPDFKGLYVSNSRRVANQLDSGRTLDISGTDISNTGTARTTSTLHTDIVVSWCCPVTVAVSFWFTKKKDNG